jgi:hypothetical protein
MYVHQLQKNAAMSGSNTALPVPCAGFSRMSQHPRNLLENLAVLEEILFDRP